MPVATQAAIKGVTPQQVEGLGITLILNNTYHLNLRPGIGVLREAGGAHRLQGWNHNLLTVRDHAFSKRVLLIWGVGQRWFSAGISQPIHEYHRTGCPLYESIHGRADDADGVCGTAAFRPGFFPI
jgi:hypothetical protein